MGGFKLLEKAKIARLPKSPGVYALKKGRELLYIGKAANIKKRVKDHFQRPVYRDNLFINQVKKVGFIKTDSEIEALVLEAKLIRKYRPKFNVVWRDDKNYFFAGITLEDFPRVFWTHQPIKISSSKYQVSRRGVLNTKYKILNTEFIGPFVDGKALKQTLKILRKIFPYRSCKRLPKRPCLWYQLDRCPAPCLARSKLGKQIPLAKSNLEKESKANAKNLIKILQGKKRQVLVNLKKEMKKAAKLQSFERAAKIRDQIGALEKTLSHSRILQQAQDEYAIPRRSPLYHVWEEVEKELRKILKIKNRIERIEGYDVSNIQGKEATGSMITFTKGRPDKNFYRRFKVKIEEKPNDVAMLREVLNRRFSHPEWNFPDLILIDGGIAQLNAALGIKNSAFAGASADKQKSKVKSIKVVALAKRGNKLYIEGRKRPVLLKNLPREIFNLILQIRDEAHRFAVSYHRRLREKTIFPE